MACFNSLCLLQRVSALSIQSCNLNMTLWPLADPERHSWDIPRLLVMYTVKTCLKSPSLHIPHLWHFQKVNKKSLKSLLSQIVCKCNNSGRRLAVSRNLTTVHCCMTINQSKFNNCKLPNYRKFWTIRCGNFKLGIQTALLKCFHYMNFT